MIELNGELWEFRFVSPTDTNLYDPNNGYTLGVCDGVNNIIYISNSLPKFKRRTVIIHELVHAICDSYNIKINSTDEEVLAQTITSVIGAI